MNARFDHGHHGAGWMSLRESTPTSIGLKAIRSVAALGVRQIVVQGLNALTAVVLARLLSPSDFGLFAIITFVLAFLVAFGDVGLGASLDSGGGGAIERRLSGGLYCPAIVGVGRGLWWRGLFPRSWRAPTAYPPTEAILFRLVALSLLFTSFRVIPSRSLGTPSGVSETRSGGDSTGGGFLWRHHQHRLGWIAGRSASLWVFSVRSVAGAAIINCGQPLAHRLALGQQ